MAQQKIYYHSPIGYFEIVGSDKGLQSLKRVARAGKDDLNPCALLLDCKKQLMEYFNRQRQQFSIPLDWSTTTAFNQSVWNALLEIPYGQTTSYSDIAAKINNPKAVRAVGLANKLNPIAIIVPCHRVIGKNGDLTGYFYGLEVKQQLLELENPMSFAKQGTLF